MKTIEVIGENEINVKRFYLPIKVDIECPHCKEKNEKDFESDYLSYPFTNKKEAVYICCDHCDEEYEFDVSLGLKLDVDTKARKL